MLDPNSKKSKRDVISAKERRLLRMKKKYSELTEDSFEKGIWDDEPYDDGSFYTQSAPEDMDDSSW